MLRRHESLRDAVVSWISPDTGSIPIGTIIVGSLAMFPSVSMRPVRHFAARPATESGSRFGSRPGSPILARPGDSHRTRTTGRVFPRRLQCPVRTTTERRHPVSWVCTNTPLNTLALPVSSEDMRAFPLSRRWLLPTVSVGNPITVTLPRMRAAAAPSPATGEAAAGVSRRRPIGSARCEVQGYPGVWITGAGRPLLLRPIPAADHTAHDNTFELGS